MRRLVLFIFLVVVATTWFAWLRPTALGGQVAYVVVVGSSMEPTYDDGDLVLVRREQHYDRGDVIAFRAGGRFDDPTRIIHRIVGHDPGRGFITQGDNRDRTDPWFPQNDDIIGRATLHLPMAGSVAGVITRPQFFAAMGGAAVVLGGTKRRHRRRSRATDQAEVTSFMKRAHRIVIRPTPIPERLLVSRGSRFTQPRWAFIGLLICAGMALPVLGLTWSALRAPDSIERTEPTGSIDYGIGLDFRFSGTPSAVYPDGTVEASRNAAGALVADSPLYSRLVDRLDVTVAFRATESNASRLRSDYSIDVLVETPGGWSTTLESVGEESFERSTSETIAIDLPAVLSQVESVAELTGVGGDSYTIRVSPRLAIQAEIEGDDVNEELTAPMSFTVEGNLITAEAVEASDTRTLTRTVSQRAMYSIGPVEMRTQPARATLSGLALVLVAGIAWFASVLFGGLGLPESDRIAARYRSQVVDVAVATAPPGPVVMVGGIDELSRIAKIEQTVILHENLGEGAHRYRVFLGSVTYEYETAPEHPGKAVHDDEVASGSDPASG